MLASIENSQLVIIDIQERLFPLTQNYDVTKNNIANIVKTCSSLDIPMHLFEQYPEKLGKTDPNIQEIIPHILAQGKMSFSCFGVDYSFVQIDQYKKEEIILCGIETHVCILQTALNLQAMGYKVFCVVDAVSSRFKIDHDTALQRMSQCGVTLVTTEMLVFEWLRTSKHPHFKALAAPFKDRK